MLWAIGSKIAVQGWAVKPNGVLKPVWLPQDCHRTGSALTVGYQSLWPINIGKPAKAAMRGFGNVSARARGPLGGAPAKNCEVEKLFQARRAARAGTPEATLMLSRVYTAPISPNTAPQKPRQDLSSRDRSTAEVFRHSCHKTTAAAWRSARFPPAVPNPGQYAVAAGHTVAASL